MVLLKKTIEILFKGTKPGNFVLNAHNPDRRWRMIYINFFLYNVLGSDSFLNKIYLKELSFCHKIKFCNPYMIFPNQYHRPQRFQTLNFVRLKI